MSTIGADCRQEKVSPDELWYTNLTMEYRLYNKLQRLLNIDFTMTNLIDGLSVRDKSSQLFFYKT